MNVHEFELPAAADRARAVREYNTFCDIIGYADGKLVAADLAPSVTAATVRDWIRTDLQPMLDATMFAPGAGLPPEEDDWLLERVADMEDARALAAAQARHEAQLKAEAERVEAARKKAIKDAEDAKKAEAAKQQRLAQWRRVNDALDTVIYDFGRYTPAGFIEQVRDELRTLDEDSRTLLRFGLGVYLGAILQLMKRSSLHRKEKQADAVIEYICALKGCGVAQDSDELPSTVAQFDDESYVPPFHQHQWLLIRDTDAAFLQNFLPETLPVLRDPPLDTIARLRDSANVRDAEELAEAEDVEFIARGLIQKGTVVLITGRQKVAKSLLATDLCLSFASPECKNWMGLPIVSDQSVLYLNAEGSMSQRLAAYKKEHGKLPKKFHALQLKHKLDDAGMVALLQIIEAHEKEHGPIGVLVIDPLARAIEGSEISDRDMAAFIDRAESLTAGGRTVLVLHHLGKDESAGPRGHSSLSGAVTAELRLTLDPKTGIRTISNPFVREAEPWEGARFRLKPVPLGDDAFGMPLQSAVVERVGGAGNTGAAAGLGKNQKAVYTVLKALAAEVGEPQPDGTVRVGLDVLIERAGTEMKVAPDRRGERVRDALKGMGALVGQSDGQVWVIT